MSVNIMSSTGAAAAETRRKMSELFSLLGREGTQPKERAKTTNYGLTPGQLAYCTRVQKATGQDMAAVVSAYKAELAAAEKAAQDLQVLGISITAAQVRAAVKSGRMTGDDLAQISTLASEAKSGE